MDYSHFAQGDTASLVLRLRRQLIRDVFHRAPIAGQTVEEVNSYYCYHFLPHAYQFIILRVLPKFRARRAISPQLLLQVEARMRSELTPVFHELETAIIDGRIICLFNITTHRDSPGTDQFKLSIGRFFAELSTSEDYADYEFVMAEGTPAENILQLEQCFQSAVQAMEYGAIYGLNQRYDSYDQVQVLDNIMSILTTKRKNQMRHYVETLNMEQLTALIGEIFQVSYDEVVQNPGLAYRLPKRVLELTAAAIRDNVPPSQELNKLLAQRLQLIDDCLYLDDLHRLTEEGVAALCDFYRRHLSPGGSPAIISAKAYILEHYRKKVYLNDIADHVLLNPQYLSVLFKQETGISITDYLAGVRMEQAKLALRTTNDTVQAIAEAVGYPDAHYFSRVFKQHVGLPPLRYRNANKKK